MNEIKCPNCGTVFTIDKKDYESILKQIKDKEFNHELEQAVKLTEMRLEKVSNEEMNKKELELASLKNQLSSIELEVKNKIEKEYIDKINNKSMIINNLENTIKNKDLEKAIELKDAIASKDKEIDSLTIKLESSKNEYLEKEQNLKNQYDEKIKDKDEQITYYKDFKAKQSTKMIGESLEQHCNTEFNRIRPLFGNAYFEKDNDAKTGSKGDFIFRECDSSGIEILSIMFEMKNEADETSSKHKNEDFLKELDKDRKEKNCEYAVLVSLLEIDNDLYNNGIVDMSHKYPKMYVIRPQFFIPMITLLRSSALNALDYKKELELVKNQNIDISHFEENVNVFKEGFARNYRLASEKFATAIEEIDKSINHLQKIKESLQSSENNLRLANNKAEDLTIKKLTSNSPTMQKMFEDIKNNNN